MCQLEEQATSYAPVDIVTYKLVSLDKDGEFISCVPIQWRRPQSGQWGTGNTGTMVKYHLGADLRDDEKNAGFYLYRDKPSWAARHSFNVLQCTVPAGTRFVPGTDGQRFTMRAMRIKVDTLVK